MANVELDTPIRDDFVGAAEIRIHAALSRHYVDGAVVASGARTALVRQALTRDVWAGLAFVLQRAEVTQQAVQAQIREDQSCCGQQDEGQQPAWSHTNLNSHTHLNRSKSDRN